MNRGFFVAGASLCVATLAQGAERPNVVFIISDQHQKMATGCYGSVQRTLDGESPTPNIDELARRGVTFTNAYTPSPLSAPARAALTVGCYPHQNTAIRHKEQGREAGVVRFPGIKDELKTIAESFRDAGYKTGAIGKMHVHGELKGVEDLGYDYVDLRFYTVYPGAHYGDRANGDWNKRYREMKEYASMTYHEIDAKKYKDVDPNLTVKKNSNNPNFLESIVERSEQMLDHLTADESIKFMERRAKSGEPFYLHVGLEKPHEPYTTHKKYMDRFSPEKVVLPVLWDEVRTTGMRPFMMKWMQRLKVDERDVRGTIAAYYACVNDMDEQVGRVVQATKDLGIYDNTIFIYTTDHGDHMYTHSMLQKHCMYETATNVPLIISYPKKYDEGVVSDALVSTLDLMPTMLDFAGVAIPESFVGRSLVDYREVERSDRYIFSEFYEAGKNYLMFPEATALPMRMVRNGRYKYVYTHGFIDQLYDLESDPNEQRNLVLDGEKYREVIERLKSVALANWAVDIYPLCDVEVRKSGKKLKFAPSNFELDGVVEDGFRLYKSKSNCAVSGVEVACGTIDQMEDVMEEDEAYYWITATPKLVRQFAPSLSYKGVDVATERLAKRLPASVMMRVEASDRGVLNFEYELQSVYTGSSKNSPK